MYQGSYTALITPFDDNSVDEDVLARLIDWQIEQGSHGLVPVGTTGESPTLSHDEHKRIVELTVKVVKGRIPVIAGAGSNCTSEAIEFSRHAESTGADALLHVAGYYNRPSLEGDYKTALKYQDMLMPLHESLFLEPSPAGVKYAVSRLGLCSEACRLPIVPLSPGTKLRIDEAMDLIV